mgnify:CR=1 FL=1
MSLLINDLKSLEKAEKDTVFLVRHTDGLEHKYSFETLAKDVLENIVTDNADTTSLGSQTKPITQIYAQTVVANTYNGHTLGKFDDMTSASSPESSATGTVVQYTDSADSAGMTPLVSGTTLNDNDNIEIRLDELGSDGTLKQVLKYVPATIKGTYKEIGYSSPRSLGIKIGDYYLGAASTFGVKRQYISKDDLGSYPKQAYEVDSKYLATYADLRYNTDMHSIKIWNLGQVDQILKERIETIITNNAYTLTSDKKAQKFYVVGKKEAAEVASQDMDEPYNFYVSKNDANAVTVTIDTDNSSTLSATYVANAIWNDIADYLEVDEDLEVIYGRTYTRDPETLKIRLAQKNEPIIGIASDTCGFKVGRNTDIHQIPIAIGGWVLAYVDNTYKPGTLLKVGDDGILTKATKRDEIFNAFRVVASYDRPEPQESWHGKEVKGRHWVKVRS